MPVLSGNDPWCSRELRRRADGGSTRSRLAMRCEPIASASVTVGSSPSATLVTMMPMAKMKFSQLPLRIARPMVDRTDHPEHERESGDYAADAADLDLER